jgi:hypothetical protein
MQPKIRANFGNLKSNPKGTVACEKILVTLDGPMAATNIIKPLSRLDPRCTWQRSKLLTHFYRAYRRGQVIAQSLKAAPVRSLDIDGWPT